MYLRTAALWRGATLSCSHAVHILPYHWHTARPTGRGEDNTLKSAVHDAWIMIVVRWLLEWHISADSQLSMGQQL